MPDLLLDEQWVVAVLDQVRDVGVAQAVQAQLRGQAGRGAVLGEAGPQGTEEQPGCTLTRPQRVAARGSVEQLAVAVEPLPEDPHRPREHR